MRYFFYVSSGYRFEFLKKSMKMAATKDKIDKLPNRSKKEVAPAIIIGSKIVMEDWDESFDMGGVYWRIVSLEELVKF